MELLEEEYQIARRISQPSDVWENLFPELKRLVVSLLDFSTLMAFSKASKDSRIMASPYLFEFVDLQNRSLSPVKSLQNFANAPSSPVKIHHYIKNATILGMYGEDHYVNSIISGQPLSYDNEDQDQVPGAVLSALTCLTGLRTVKLDVSAVSSHIQDRLQGLLKGIQLPYVTRVSIHADAGIIGAFMNACSADRVTSLDMPCPVDSNKRSKLYSDIGKRQRGLTILRVVTVAPVALKEPTMMQPHELEDIADSFPQLVKLHADCGLGYGDKIYGTDDDDNHYHTSRRQWHKEFKAALVEFKRLTCLKELAISVIPKTWNRGPMWYYRPAKMLFRELPHLEKLFILEHWRKWYEVCRRDNTLVIRDFAGWNCDDTFPDSSACRSGFLHFCTLSREDQ